MNLTYVLLTNHYGGSGGETPWRCRPTGIWVQSPQPLEIWALLESKLCFFVIIFAEIRQQNFCSFKVKMKAPFTYRCTLHPAYWGPGNGFSLKLVSTAIIC